MEKLDPYDAWVPNEYLADYYDRVQEDERSTIKFFVEKIRDAASGPVLSYGCGPTLHHAFLTAPRMTELYLADYVPRNFEPIADWKRDAAGAHDWTPFVRYTLLCETGAPPRPRDVSARMTAIRKGIAAMLRTDAGLSDPLGANFRGRFATVVNAYCADCATTDKTVWTRYCRNIASLVRPGGLMLASALRNCRAYKAGGRTFPGANIDEADMRAVLEQDFLPDSIEIQVSELSEHAAQGYSGIVLARAVKGLTVRR